MNRSWYRPMVPRSADEAHRVATPLELLFDLCFVVAVARAGVGLEHQLGEGHGWTGLGVYLAVFFAIWWAWMNFTWFASAYDTDDVPYRITTLVQIAGSLVMAAGVGRAMAEGDFTVVTWGYVVMRLAMVAQWLRAARSDPSHRDTALRYAAGITIVQIGWVARLSLPDGLMWTSFIILVLAELAVPAVAEFRNRTTYHPEHMIDRYGAFTVIVLGEAVTAAALAVQSGVDEGSHGGRLIGDAACGLLVLFALWWLYFDRPVRARLDQLRTSLTWGYLHFFVFAGVAAVGAGISLTVNQQLGSGEEHPGSVLVAAAVAVPVALYLVMLAALHGAGSRSPRVPAALIVGAIASLVSVFVPGSLAVLAVALLVCAIGVSILAREKAQREQAQPE